MPCVSVRPEIASLKAYVPGLSIDEIRQRYGLPHIVKLASNENPFGTPPRAIEAIQRFAAMAFRYPQGGNPRLVAALAKQHGVAPEEIAVGNGSDEILDLLLRILPTPGHHNIVCFQPCFSIYTIQSQICGVEVRQHPLKQDFSFDFDALLSKVDQKTRLVFITTPDNPSGYCPSLEDVHSFAQALAQRSPEAFLVIDEAYVDFAGEHDGDEARFSLLTAGKRENNTIFTRTFSKSYGLAGVRLGYAVMPQELASFYWRSRLPFSVNILAEEAALAALQDTAFRTKTLCVTRQERARVTAALQALDFHVWPSQANFVLCKPLSRISAEECFQKLLAQGIIVRPLQSYGLPEYLRISIGTEEENSLLLHALTSI